MATKSNQNGVDNEDFLRFPLSLSREWSISKEWPLSKEWSLSMFDMSLISKEDWLISQEWQSKQSTLDFVANEWCSPETPSFPNTRSATFGRFAQQSKNEQTGQESTTELKTKSKKGGTTDWLAMYHKALAPASVPFPINSVPDAIKSPSLKNPKPKRPRKVIPKEKVYVDKYTDFDVIFGRGGRSNHHPGNKMYRVQVTEKQQIYRSCEDKKGKTVIAQSAVDHVNKNQKGRFLELDTTCNRWYIVPNNVARTKVGQALRDNNTKEARAAKRNKYGC